MLDDHKSLRLTEKLGLALKFGIQEWILPTFQTLVHNSTESLTLEDVESLPVPVFFYLQLTKSRVERSRLLLAYTESLFIWSGEGICEMSEAECTEGWSHIWWNGPAMLILHPQDPHTIQAVSKTLQEADIPKGRICPFCWTCCLQKLDQRAIAAEKHFQKLITDGVTSIKPFFTPHTWFEEEDHASNLFDEL